MGLLDDAIREHLELKRQHGADPEEVSRQEDEALGPAPRRAEFAQSADDGEPAQDAAEPAPGDDEPAPGGGGGDDDVAAYAAPAAPDELPEGQPGVPEEPAVGREADAPGYDEDPWLEEDEDEPAARPAAPGDEPPAEGEDVLEETPEFLQETPEHDRLWFEQKPPRDFDWDR
jgi:hypothetical protein